MRSENTTGYFSLVTLVVKLNYDISEPQTKKIEMTILFLTLQFKKAKYPYCSDEAVFLICSDMAVFWYFLGITGEWCSEKKKMTRYQPLNLNWKTNKGTLLS